MVKEGQRVPTICPICGKKILAVATADGILRLVCSVCKMVATSKYKDKRHMEIIISFAQ